MKKVFIILFLVLAATGSKAQLKKVKHVVLIGCDGLGAYAIPKAEMPNLKSLMKTGAWSLKARAVLPSSSAVNWASMLMGSSPTDHGYTEWDSKTPEIPSSVTSSYGIFPSIFSVVRDQLPDQKTAIIYSWSGIGPLVEKNAIDFYVNGKGKDDFCVDTAAKIIQEEKPLFSFIHLSEPDGAGHNEGHDTPAYYNELKKVDARIGKIIKAIKDAGIEDETVLILTSDHGGIEKGHGGKTLAEIEIPWVIHGKGVKVDHEIKDVIMTYDTAATISWILGLEMPQAWRGRNVLESFK